jgi:hypothetical protein
MEMIKEYLLFLHACRGRLILESVTRDGPGFLVCDFVSLRRASFLVDSLLFLVILPTLVGRWPRVSWSSSRLVPPAPVP